MKVLLVSTGGLFEKGPDHATAECVATRLVDEGHDIERLSFPFSLEPTLLPTQLTMMRLLEVEGVDHLVALDLPAALLRTEAPKTVCLTTGGAPSESVAGSTASESHRRVVLNAIRGALGETTQVFTTSGLQAVELSQSVGLRSQIVKDPHGSDDADTHAHNAGPILVVGDIDGRHHHIEAVSALAYVDRSIRLVITGIERDANYAHRVRDRIARLGLVDRVVFDPCETSAQEMAARIDAAPAVVCFSSTHDDGVILAAAAATRRTPLITFTGSAVPYSICTSGHTGWRVSRRPASVAHAISQATDHSLAAALGNAAHMRAIEGRRTLDDAIAEALR